MIGSGIAGPAVAVALRSAGIEAELYESSERSDPRAGLFLTLAVNGMRALDHLGLLDGVLEHRPPPVPTPTLVFESTSGKRIGEVSNGRLEPGLPAVTLRRGDLHAALLAQALRKGIPVHRGRRLVRAEESSGTVTAHFDDGSIARADLLVGADGIRSVVRHQIDPDAPRARETRLVNVGGMLEHSLLEPTSGEMRMLWGRRAFFGHTVSDDGRAMWFANIPRSTATGEALTGGDVTRLLRSHLLELFADEPGPVSKIIAATPEIGAWPIEELPRVPRWHSRRMVLVGDAAHAVSPSTGQGASLAVEDAVVLSRELSKADDPSVAFRRYAAERAPRAVRVLEEGRKRGAYKAPSNRLSLFLRDLLLPLALPVFANEKRLAWLHEYEAPA